MNKLLIIHSAIINITQHEHHQIPSSAIAQKIIKWQRIDLTQLHIISYSLLKKNLKPYKYKFSFLLFIISTSLSYVISFCIICLICCLKVFTYIPIQEYTDMCALSDAILASDSHARLVTVLVYMRFYRSCVHIYWSHNSTCGTPSL